MASLKSYELDCRLEFCLKFYSLELLPQGLRQPVSIKAIIFLGEREMRAGPASTLHLCSDHCADRT